MDAPKCRLCGDRHYGICATKSTAVRTDVQVAATDSKFQIAGTQAPPVDTNRRGKSRSPDNTSAGTVSDKDRHPFDRRTYARDYMKEWRKRKTEERSTDRAFVEAARLTLDAETFDKILRLAMEKN